MYKKEVKNIAESCPEFQNLRILKKRESMGVCFIGKRKMSEFLPNYFNPTPGRFIDIDSGTILGTHDGAEIFTVGQGARISGAPEKYFVIKKKVNSGDIYVGMGVHHPGLHCESLDITANQFNWIHGGPPIESTLLPLSPENPIQQFECEFQCRHQQQPIPCRVSLIYTLAVNDQVMEPSPLPLSSAPEPLVSSNSSSTIIRIDPLNRSIRSPVPGQIAVLYQGNLCLGGGPIRHTYSSYFNSC